MTSPAIPTTVQDTVNRVVLLAAVMKAVGRERDQMRAAIAEQMPAGSRLTGRDPRDAATLGTVSLSDPAPVALVVDDAAFEEHIRAEHPGELVTLNVIGRADEVAAVLAEHAPHLLGTKTVVPDHLRERVLKAAAVQPIPGTTVVRPDPVLTVRPNSAAHRIVKEVLAGAPVPAVELEGKA